MVNEITTEKKWYQSKTLWTSAIVVAVGVLQWTNGQIDSGSSITLIGLLMAALRVITEKKLVK